ncbi:MAG: hypothetical protein GY705_08745, partial [Bacteroidetes bacterium]|nr:hypothetical protein [Bacteroidota bacterium]
EKSEKLFAELYVRYLENEKELKAQVVFFKGDSLENAQPASTDGRISFQGSEMLSRNLNGNTIRHTISFQSDYQETFTFQFQDLSSQIRKYEAGMSPIEGFIVKDQISLSNGMQLILKGEKLSRDESLVLLFSNEKHQAHSIIVEGPTESIELDIPAHQVKEFPIGNGTLYLVKKQTRPIKENYVSGTSTIEFYTNAIDVEVVE